MDAGRKIEKILTLRGQDFCAMPYEFVFAVERNYCDCCRVQVSAAKYTMEQEVCLSYSTYRRCGNHEEGKEALASACSVWLPFELSAKRGEAR